MTKTPRILIDRLPNNACDPELLSTCLFRATHLPDTMPLAYDIMTATLNAFPAMQHSQDQLSQWATSPEKIRQILIATHTLHKTFGHNIRNPLRYINDFLRFGDTPFSDRGHTHILKQLQAHMPIRDISNLRHLLNELTPFTHNSPYSEENTLWVAAKLSKLEFFVDLIGTRSDTFPYTNYLLRVSYNQEKYIINIHAKSVETQKEWLSHSPFKITKKDIPHHTLTPITKSLLSEQMPGVIEILQKAYLTTIQN